MFDLNKVDLMKVVASKEALNLSLKEVRVEANLKFSWSFRCEEIKTEGSMFGFMFGDDVKINPKDLKGTNGSEMCFGLKPFRAS